MRTLLLSCAVVALAAACASVAPVAQLATAPVRVAIDATASLSTSECEAATAPALTQVINARRTAATKLRDGAITVQRAQEILRATDDARAQIDAACKPGQPGIDPRVRARLTASLASINRLLEVAK